MLGEDINVSSGEVENGRNVIIVPDVLENPQGGSVLVRVWVSEDACGLVREGRRRETHLR
jgi:hypothetical protein